MPKYDYGKMIDNAIAKATGFFGMNPSAHPADGQAPKVNRYNKRTESDETILGKRLKSPTPAQQDAMTDAVLNIKFYEGHHFAKRSSVVSENDGTSRVQVPGMGVMPRQSVNYIKRIIDDRVSLMCRAVPSVGAEPLTYNERDKQAARIANYVLKEFMQNNEVSEAIAHCARATEITGMGVMYPYFDPNAGELMQFPEIDPIQEGVVPMMDQFLEMYEGRIRIEVGNLFNVRFDSSRNDPHRARWAIFTRIMHVDEARMRFGFEEIEPDPAISIDDFLCQSIPMHYFGNQQIQYEEEHVLVSEMYELPSPKYPDGRYIMATGKQEPFIWIKAPNPFRDSIPFIYFRETIVEDSPWPTTTFKFCRWLNKTLSKRMSQWMEDASILGRPWVLAPRGSNVRFEHMRNDQVKLIRYNQMALGGARPIEIVPPPVMPEWVMKVPDVLTHFMDRLSGMNDVIRGVNPPGARSGVMLAELMERAHSVFYPKLKQVEANWQRIGQTVIRLAQMRYIAPRLMKCSGQDMADEALFFSNSDLQGSVDIQVVAGSATPKSRNGRLQQIMELFGAGLMEPKKAQSMVEFAMMEEVNEDQRVEENLIRRETQKMKMGMPVMPSKYDNHWMHDRAHIRFMKSSTFEMLPDEIKKIFYAHHDMHSDYLMAQAGDLTGGDVNIQDATARQLTNPNQPPGA